MLYRGIGERATRQRGRYALWCRHFWGSSDLSSSVTGWPKGLRGVQRQGRNDVGNRDARPPWVGLLSIVHSSGDLFAELRKIRPALTLNVKGT